MFHVEHCFSPNIGIYVGAVHHFQAGAAFEGDEPARELFCRIMVNRVDHPIEILSVEIADLVDVFCPDGHVFDFHEFPLREYTNKFCMVPENLALFFGSTLYIL